MCKYEGEHENYFVCELTGFILTGDCDTATCSLRKRQIEIENSTKVIRVIWPNHPIKHVTVTIGETTYQKACALAGVRYLLTVEIDGTSMSQFQKVRATDRNITAVVNTKAEEAEMLLDKWQADLPTRLEHRGRLW